MHDTSETLTALSRLCDENLSLTLHYIVPNWRSPSNYGGIFFLMGNMYSIASGALSSGISSTVATQTKSLGQRRAVVLMGLAIGLLLPESRL